MRDTLIAIFVFGLAPMALFEPFVGVCLWTWLSVMNPHRLTWGFAYELPFAQVVAIATLLGLLVSYRKARFPVNPLTLTLFLLLAWVSVTTAFSIHFDLSTEPWSRVAKMLLMTMVALAVVRTEKQVIIFLWIYVLSVAFFGVKGGIFAILTGGEERVWGPPNSQIADNNEISIALLMMIPLMAFLQHLAKPPLIKLGMFVAILLCAIAVVSSYSRGALVGGSAMMMMFIAKSRRRSVLIVLVGISMSVVLVSMPQKWWDRMHTITIENPDQSIQGRFNAWGMSWNLALDRPIVGGGFGIYEPDVFAKYAPNPLDIHSAHSIYFQVLGEHGFVGLALFLTIASLMWRTATKIIRSCRTSEVLWRAELARALQVSMVGYLVGGLTVNIAYWDVFYFDAVILVALQRLALGPELGQESMKLAP